MQWSKLKKTIEGRFAPSVKDRVKIFSTQYNNPNSSLGRAWITIDGEEIVNLTPFGSGSPIRGIYHETTTTDCLTHGAINDEDRTPGKLAENGEFSRFDLHKCCWEYLQLTIEEGLQHPSPLINSLAILDKRLGTRRLVLIQKDGRHPLVKAMLAFRLKAEKLSQ